MEWDDLQLYILFTSITVISGLWECSSKRLCAMEPNLRLEKFSLFSDSKLGLLGQQVSAYRIYPAIRRGFCSSRMTSNN